MNELDEVYNSYDFQNREYSKEEYANFKRNEKQQVYDLIDATAEKSVSNEADFKKYLDTQSKFEQYSVGNIMLITAQMPEATQLREFESWKNAKAYIKKFSQGVKILEPADNYMRSDGTVGTNYNVKNVYDVSQTNSRQRNNQMRYDDKILIKILLNSSSSKVRIVDDIPNTDRKALYELESDTLFIAKGSEPPKIFHEITEELAKQELGEENSFKNKCVSYSICKKYGIDVSNYDFKDVSYRFQDMDARQIREELEPIRSATENVNNRISEYIQRLTRDNRKRENIR